MDNKEQLTSDEANEVVSGLQRGTVLLSPWAEGQLYEWSLQRESVRTATWLQQCLSRARVQTLFTKHSESRLQLHGDKWLRYSFRYNCTAYNTHTLPIKMSHMLEMIWIPNITFQQILAGDLFSGSTHGDQGQISSDADSVQLLRVRCLKQTQWAQNSSLGNLQYL